MSGRGEITLLDQKIDGGADIAVETGVETGTLVIAGHHASVHHRVTNVYRKIGDDWKLNHHHMELSEAMLDILKRLSNAA